MRRGSGGVRLAEERAQRRHEDQRHGERGGERGEQRDRQILHELADDAGPEHQRQEGGERGQRGGRDRHRHPGRGEAVGFALVQPLGHLAIGELGDDDGAVDQHADGEDQAEQHHHVDRHAGRGDQDEGSGK